MLKSKRILFGIVCSVVMSGLFSISASALEYINYYPKAEGYGLLNCYSTNGFIKRTVTLNEFNMLKDILPNISSTNDSKNPIIPLPWTKKGKIQSQRCGKYLQEYLGVSPSVSLENDDVKKKKILKMLGYEEIDGGKCVKLKYQIAEKYSDIKSSTPEDKETVGICTTNGKSFDAKSISKMGDWDDSYDPISIGIDAGGGGHVNTEGGGVYFHFNPSVFVNSGSYGVDVPFPFSSYTTFDAFVNSIGETIFQNLESDRQFTHYQKTNTDDGGRAYEQQESSGEILYFNKDNATETYGGNSSYELNTIDAKNVISVMKQKYPENELNYDGRQGANWAFTGNQKEFYYTTILEEVFGPQKGDCRSDRADDGDWNNYITQMNGKYGEKGGVATLYDKETGVVSECYYITKESSKTTVYGLNKNNIFDGTKIGFSEVIANADPTKIPDFDASTMDDVIVHVDEGDSGAYGSGGPCWNSGIESMAWVMCPVETNLKNTASGIGKLIDGWITTNSKFYDNDSATRVVWDYMRTIANVLMIVILIAIIFSQLTGYGIDNYGIKKMLPKLVLMAVLINLSFLICQLAIDLSNIVGDGMQNLFYAIGNNAGANASTLQSNLSDFIGGVVATIYGLAGGATAVMPFVTTISSGGSSMAVVLVILLLLVIVAAVIVMLVALGARTMIAVMCAALSPIAFAMYILPNTKPIFKKWADAFKASLVVYPICGAALGFSYIFKVIVVSNTTGFNLPVFVMAAVAPYLPFFIIPTLLKGAISAIGTIGAAITSMGSSLRGTVGKGVDTASGFVKSTDAYKRNVDEAARRRSEGRNTRMLSRIQKKQDSGKELSATDRMRRLRAQSALDKIHAEDTAAMTSYYNDRYANESMDSLAGYLQEELSNYSPDLKDADERKTRINALSNLMFKLDASGAAGAVSGMLENGTAFNAAQLKVLRDNMNDNRDFGGAMKGKRGSAFDMINDLGRKGDMNSYRLSALASGSASSLKDMATQSKSDIAQYANLAQTLANKTDRNETEQTALDNYNAMYAEVNNPNTNDQHALAIRGDPQKLAAWRATSATPPVTAPAADGAVAQENQQFNVQGGNFAGLSDETVLDIATQPGVAMDDQRRVAAEQEWNRRQTQSRPQGGHNDPVDDAGNVI